MLPLVRAIVADLADLSREVTDRRRRLSFLLAGRNPNNRDPYQQELVQVQNELEKDSQRLREYVRGTAGVGRRDRSAGPRAWWPSPRSSTAAGCACRGSWASPRCSTGTKWAPGSAAALAGIRLPARSFVAGVTGASLVVTFAPE